MGERDVLGRYQKQPGQRPTASESYKRNKAARDAALKKWRAANPDTARAISKRNYDKHVDWMRMKTILRKRGLTIDQYHSLNENQNFSCYLCVSYEPLHMDHHHASGRIRRLLCRRCNNALGQFKEDPALLRRAAAYVEEHHGA